MLKIKCDINQQYLKTQLTYILSNLNNFHSLEVVDRVSETQLQVAGGGEFRLNNLAVKGLKVIYHPLYGMNNNVLIWGDWLSCDPLI